MKKNVLRVLSLVLVAGMLFAFASCTQEIHVRFVDKDGNDIDISGLGFGSVQTGTDTQPNNPAPQQPSQDDITECVEKMFDATASGIRSYL